VLHAYFPSLQATAHAELVAVKPLLAAGYLAWSSLTLYVCMARVICLALTGSCLGLLGLSWQVRDGGALRHVCSGNGSASRRPCCIRL
jgi:hypothetical protein